MRRNDKRLGRGSLVESARLEAADVVSTVDLWSGRHGLELYTRWVSGTKAVRGQCVYKGKGTIERRSVRITQILYAFLGESI